MPARQTSGFARDRVLAGPSAGCARDLARPAGARREPGGRSVGWLNGRRGPSAARRRVITVDTGSGCSLRVFDAGLACCGVEVAAALRRGGALATATSGQQL